jgi:hypothetical protein
MFTFLFYFLSVSELFISSVSSFSFLPNMNSNSVVPIVAQQGVEVKQCPSEAPVAAGGGKREGSERGPIPIGPSRQQQQVFRRQ